MNGADIQSAPKKFLYKSFTEGCTMQETFLLKTPSGKGGITLSSKPQHFEASAVKAPILLSQIRKVRVVAAPRLIK